MGTICQKIVSFSQELETACDLQKCQDSECPWYILGIVLIFRWSTLETQMKAKWFPLDKKWLETLCLLSYYYYTTEIVKKRV